MRKIIASINMTLDGFCDHTSGIADEDIHWHYTGLLRSAGTVLYGRITYELMKSYWPSVVQNPTGDKSMDEFALAIEAIPKIVFSRTLKDAGWKNASLATRDIKDEVTALRQSGSEDVLVGSPSLIVALTNLGLIDEYQLAIHPVIAGKGLPLFKNISDKIILNRTGTKTIGKSGVEVLYYGRS